MKSQLEHQQEQDNIEFMHPDVDDDVSSKRPADVEDSSEEYDRPPSRYSITSYGADYPVDALVNRIKNEDIIIPEFQRSYVWKIEQASRFIESLLLGLPVPGIFLARDQENRLLVIDGQQRLKTLKFFYEGEGFFPRKTPFKLQKVAKEFEGITYKDLRSSDRRMLDNSIIPATVVRQDAPEDESEPQGSVYHIFERLNTGGSNLLPQEIRSSIHYGTFNNFLGEINKNVTWQKIFQGKESVEEPDPKNRMKDIELILRFFALFLDFNKDTYKESMKDFLTEFMKKNRNMELYRETQLSSSFENSIQLIYEILGIKAFKPRRGLNAAVFDAVMVGIARRLKQGRIENLERFKAGYNQLLENTEFLDVSINARQISSFKNVERRIEIATESFQAVP